MTKKKTAAKKKSSATKKTNTESKSAKTDLLYPLQENVEDEVFALVNQAREAAGLQPLSRLEVLFEAAEAKAQDMRDNTYFDHLSPTYGTPGQMLTQFGVEWTAYGENIAAGQRTPAAVMEAWMNSPGHRANILSPKFTQMGVGYAPGTTDSRYRTYWVQEFVRL
ncbi:CAP domain-containing protein [Paenibacillus sp. JDR-2]|uniref:CAP domain-containing protein n=1 Tax=Paenibacillus sp. (strain JDR-2) TaxID=324057 RepID=UPI0001664B06|nr:CAP domain-containing protein [Paenibacillus sp. JDR-2]ACS99739.1 SCP-like extracellular [Paenibacillus sp. JDR-2]